MDNLFEEITDDELLFYTNDLELDSNDELFNYDIEKKDDLEDNELQHNTEECQTKHLLKTSEEHNLSQKLSQLSTSHHQPSTIPVNVIVNQKEDMTQTIPDYLSKENQSFEQFISNQQISSNGDPIIIEELRTMAILMYQILTLNLQKSLWMIYLKSGTGQLDSQDQKDLLIRPQFWPPQMIQTMSMERKESTTNDSTTCLNYVTNQLGQYDEQMKKYENELTKMQKKYSTSNYIETLKAYVQQGLTSIRRNIELQIALIQYDYNAHVLELIFLQNHPTDYQKQIIKHLCHTKYQEEVATKEFDLLQQQISNRQHSLPSLPQEPLFNTTMNHINNEDIQKHQQQLYVEYRKVAEKAREDMIQLYLTSAKAQMDHYEKQFKDERTQMRVKQDTLLENEKLTHIMVDLLDKQLKNISEAIECVYNYKVSELIPLNLSNA